MSNTLLRMCALVMFVFACTNSAWALTEEEKQAKLAELRATIEQVKKELENVKSNRDSMMSELEQSEKKISELNKVVEKLKGELQDKQSNLQDLRKNREALSLVKKQQTQAASSHLNAAYRLGSQSSVKLLLNQQTPANVSRNLKYFDYIVKARNQKIGELLGTLNELNRVEPQIARELNSIEQRQKNLSQQQNALQLSQVERKATLVKLEQTFRTKDAQLKSLQQDRSQLTAVLSRVIEVSSELEPLTVSQPFAKLKGNLPWPTSGRVLRSFGSERVKGKLRWQGVLIAANEGTPVNAIHEGRVVFSDYLRGQGLLVIVDHGAGFMSLYAHNQALYKQIGDWVQGGEQIASVGLSGGQKTASLYFELRFKGEPTNPQGWLKRA